MMKVYFPLLVILIVCLCSCKKESLTSEIKENAPVVLGYEEVTKAYIAVVAANGDTLKSEPVVVIR